MTESGNTTIDFSSYPKTAYATPEYAFITPPKYVGAYRVGGNHGFSIAFTKKPIWIHRTMMKLCLGWEWKDGPVV